MTNATRPTEALRVWTQGQPCNDEANWHLRRFPKKTTEEIVVW